MVPVPRGHLKKRMSMGNGIYVDRLVSIITPVYNKGRHVGECIESVIAQTYPYWELLLVDDCSRDNSASVIRRYLDRGLPIRYVRLDCNGGAAAARNRGLELARGRYVAFLDADDVWLPDKLQLQIDWMMSRRLGFTYTAIEMIDEDGRRLRGKRPVIPAVNYRTLLSNTVIACSSVVIDRAAVGDFRMPSVRKGQDFATWLAILRNGGEAYGLDRVCVRYRVAPDSVSSNKWGALRRTWHIYRRCEHIGVLPACGYFVRYVWHALRKYFGP